MLRVVQPVADEEFVLHGEAAVVNGLLRALLLQEGHAADRGGLPRAEELLEGYERSLGCIARDRLLQKALDTIIQNAQALASVPEAAPQAGAILRAVQKIKE